MNLLVTGGSGYIGKKLISYLSKKNFSNITVLTRDKKLKFNNNNVKIIYYNKFNHINLHKRLSDIDYIIHLISKQHEISKTKKQTYEDYYYANVEILRKVIQFAKKTSVKKIFYTSTVKVYGEYTLKNICFHVSSKFNPVTDYAKTKLLAEENLKKDLKNSNIKYTILRLPLVYGSEEKGNLKLLYKLISLNLPLPFKKINNQKSLLHINNLLEIFEKIITSNLGDNKEFIICDDKDFSTTEIVKIIITKLNKKNYLFSFPHLLLINFISLFYKEHFLIKLYCSLKVDNKYVKRIMKWKPKFNLNDI